MPAPESRLPDWQRAHGAPLFRAVIKQSPADFEVTEVLGFDLSDDGEHDFLWIEKQNANTAWVARQLARHAGVPAKDVGYAGLKDRHAVTRQWFSVRRPSGAGTDWEAAEIAGVRILETRRNRRKLRRGAHAGNAFRIVVRAADCPAPQVDERLGRIAAAGVPNYFGPQRFGRDGGNLGLARSLFAGTRLQRDRRSIALSAARSYLFNEVLSRRVAERTWDRALAGDLVSLDGRASFFPVPTVTDDILTRVENLDLHPTGPLWGRPDIVPDGQPARTEREVAERHADLSGGLEAAGAAMGRRALRTVPRQLIWRNFGGTLSLSFQLERGAFATALLREICSFEPVSPSVLA
jgi:tRNA pseudouridine13 synthase